MQLIQLIIVVRRQSSLDFQRGNFVTKLPAKYRQPCFRHTRQSLISFGAKFNITVDAMEVLIKYCMNSFPQVDQFIRIQISFYFLCASYWSIGSGTKSYWLI
jgi:hypothetical protein